MPILHFVSPFRVFYYNKAFRRVNKKPQPLEVAAFIWYRRVELNKALQNIDLDENRQNKALTGHEVLHPGHSQENATMCNVEAATLIGASSTSQDTLQTTESIHPLHIPDTSKAVEIALNDLAVVIKAWPRLPDSMRKGIIAMVQSVPNPKD